MLVRRSLQWGLFFRHVRHQCICSGAHAGITFVFDRCSSKGHRDIVAKNSVRNIVQSQMRAAGCSAKGSNKTSSDSLVCSKFQVRCWRTGSGRLRCRTCFSQAAARWPRRRCNSSFCLQSRCHLSSTICAHLPASAAGPCVVSARWKFRGQKQDSRFEPAVWEAGSGVDARSCGGGQVSHAGDRSLGNGCSGRSVPSPSSFASNNIFPRAELNSAWSFPASNLQLCMPMDL